MNIAREIQASVYEANGLPCFYGTREQINEIISSDKIPCVFFTLLNEGTITENTGRVSENFVLSIVFAEKTEFDFGAYENEDIIETCKQRAFCWLSKVRRGDFNFIGGTITRSGRVYEQFDDILTGYYLSINITTLAQCY